VGIRAGLDAVAWKKLPVLTGNRTSVIQPVAIHSTENLCK